MISDALKPHHLLLVEDVEDNAQRIREHMDVAISGPVGNLMELLENRGVLVFAIDLDNDAFSGMN